MKKLVLLFFCIDREATITKKEKYQSMTDFIIFLIVKIRPDIAFTTLVAAWFAKNLSHQYIKIVKIILQYLKSSREQGITFGDQNKLLVTGYSDSDWAEDKDSQKST